MSTPSLPLRIETIDLDDGRELDALMESLLVEGNRRIQADVAECIRLGIVDEKGNLLRDDLPEDMQENAETDFGG